MKPIIYTDGTSVTAGTYPAVDSFDAILGRTLRCSSIPPFSLDDLQRYDDVLIGDLDDEREMQEREDGEWVWYEAIPKPYCDFVQRHDYLLIGDLSNERAMFESANGYWVNYYELEEVFRTKSAIGNKGTFDMTNNDITAGVADITAGVHILQSTIKSPFTFPKKAAVGVLQGTNHDFISQTELEQVNRKAAVQGIKPSTDFKLATHEDSVNAFKHTANNYSELHKKIDAAKKEYIIANRQYKSLTSSKNKNDISLLYKNLTAAKNKYESLLDQELRLNS